MMIDYCKTRNFHGHETFTLFYAKSKPHVLLKWLLLVTLQWGVKISLQPKGPVTQGQQTNYVLIANKFRLLRDLDRLCVVVRDVQSAHESRTDRVRTALIALKTR